MILNLSFFFFITFLLTWGLNDHMGAAICMEAFDAVTPRLPVNWSLDRKGSLIITFIVMLFFCNNLAQRTAGNILQIFGRFFSMTINKKGGCLFFQNSK